MRRTALLLMAAAAALIGAGCVQQPPPSPGPELCPVGFFSATGEPPCTPAPAGTFVHSVGATEATLCDPGTFQDQEGQIACVPAAPGSFVAVSAAVAANLCALGSYQPLQGQTSCLLAPIGSYVDVTGAIDKTECPDWWATTEFEGSASLSDCVDAPLMAVAYSNDDGVDGYDRTGTDVLIAAVLDTNLDDGVSAGDTVVTFAYPTGFTSSLHGHFRQTRHVVAAVDVADPGLAVVVVDSAGNEFSILRDATQETYDETDPSTGKSVTVSDSLSGGGSEMLKAQLGAPSDPDNIIDPPSTLPGDGTDNPFIDVDVLV